MSVEGIADAGLWAIIPLVALGSVLHFVYDWSGHHRLAAIVSAVNESYWEHIKIALWPVAIAQVALFALGGWMLPSFIPAATVALYSVPVTMIGVVFLYKSITKKNVLWLDITVFALAIGIAQLVFALVLQELAASPLTIAVSALFLAGMVVAFLTFTLRPPSEPDFFIDPLTSKYGVHGHGDADTAL